MAGSVTHVSAIRLGAAAANVGFRQRLAGAVNHRFSCDGRAVQECMPALAISLRPGVRSSKHLVPAVKGSGPSGPRARPQQGPATAVRKKNWLYAFSIVRVTTIPPHTQGTNLTREQKKKEAYWLCDLLTPERLPPQPLDRLWLMGGCTAC